ncbi:MAG: sigma 54-interacting transcriptional regulator [Candidatus Brocadiia bacterium]
MLVFEVRGPEGKSQRRQLPEREVTLGRDGANDIALADSGVSRFHAAIVRKGSGEYVLRDLGSRNGLTVNDAAAFRHVLQPDDAVSLGSHTIVYHGTTEGPQEGPGPRSRRPRSRRSQTLATTEAGVSSRRLPTAVDGLGLKGGSLDGERLVHVLKCAHIIASTATASLLVARLLESVLSCLEAERGFVLRRDEGGLVCEARRPEGEQGQPLAPTSAQAAYEAIDAQAPVACDGKGPDGLDALCIPLLFEGRAAGVVGAEGAFRELSEIPGLKTATALCGLCAAHVANARERAHLRQQCTRLRDAVEASYRMVGSSAVLDEILTQVDQAAQRDFPVLITGATGTGKELVARAIHQLSDRRDGPLVNLNCAAIPETLLESEMFGYAPQSGIAGANPGGKPGKFELADGGTLLLDEIGDLSPLTQAKLLRVLETGEVERLSATQPVKVDVRIVAATNQDLEAKVEDGSFRADLYHRVRGFEIALPPLAKRSADILLLAAYFLEQQPGHERLAIPHATARLLTTYSWPGNIRELKRAIETAAARTAGSRLDPEAFPRQITDAVDSGRAVKSLRQVEKEHIHRVLGFADGNKRKAASLLGISPQTLYDKIKEYGIALEDRTDEG